MNEFARALRLATATNFSTAIQQVNYPIHNGQPNPKHGLFFFVGSIPAACYDQDRQGSKFYATEQDAIDAAREAGATRIQRCDCSFVDVTTPEAC